jgi:hypothetical protein
MLVQQLDEVLLPWPPRSDCPAPAPMGAGGPAGPDRYPPPWAPDYPAYLT